MGLTGIGIFKEVLSDSKQSCGIKPQWICRPKLLASNQPTHLEFSLIPEIMKIEELF